MKGLSKSRYTTFCQCPKALWLRVYKPELQNVDEALQARFDTGNEVGDLAMGLFGDYVEVTVRRSDGGLDLTKMIERTKDEMARGTNNICEASFAKDGNYCAVDILRRNGDGWDIYEVKSSTSSVGDEVNNPDKFVKYAVDIAYQRWLLEQCGVKVTGTYLVTLNRDYVRHGNLDIHQLFNILDLKNLVNNEYLKVPARVKLAQQVLQQQQEPPRPIGDHCSTPYGCAFWDYCAHQQGLPSDNRPTVFDLYRLRGSKKMEFFNAGKITFEDISNEPLSDIQRMQVDCTLNGTERIDKAGIKGFLNGLSYPLYFLDFETMQPPVPLFDNSKPYQQITFQYSLHYIEHEGGELKHTAFLAPGDGTDPRRALAEALCRDIPKNACTMAYNDPFEKGRIRELAALYPDLSAHLMNIHDHIQDLLVPFKRGCYYVPAMGGSFSIKSVLPALFPNDPDLNYKNLKGPVHNGGDAMTIFPQIVHMAPDKAKVAREALLEYCHLDTLAMVKLWQKLRETT